MRAEYVLDASVAAAAFFSEAASTPARSFIVSAPQLVAPDLVFVEVASVAAKKVRGDEVTAEVALRALSALAELLVESIPSRELAPRAFDLASSHGFSAYDALYLTLAERRRTCLVSLDAKLIARARAAGLEHLVMDLPQP